MEDAIVDFSNIELLIFDCDGTLFDTLPLHYMAWCDVYRIQGKKFCSKEYFIKKLAGISGIETVSIINQEMGYCLSQPELVKQKEAIFMREYIMRAKPIPKVLAIAREYYGIIPMVVASGGEAKAVNLMLDYANIRLLFDSVVTMEDVTQTKPAPDIFLEAAKRLRKIPAKCFVFEDSEAGFEAARRAGMKFIDIKIYQN